MRVSILTLFPDAVCAYTETSLMGRAQKNKKLSVSVLNIRDFARDKHHTTDERPFGGGPGMLMKAEPIVRGVLAAARGALRQTQGKQKKAKTISKKQTLVVITDATGKVFSQTSAKLWPKKYKHLIFICGRYEGIDARVSTILKSEGFQTQHMSIGDFVLTGGELPALVMLDACARHVVGVLGDADSLEESRDSLGVPSYTRPAEVVWKAKGKKAKFYRVPSVLESGDHARVAAWRKENKKMLTHPQ